MPPLASTLGRAGRPIIFDTESDVNVTRTRSEATHAVESLSALDFWPSTKYAPQARLEAGMVANGESDVGVESTTQNRGGGAELVCPTPIPCSKG